ncbi:DUF3239 domain-containing protein [Isosphaeraceae bacterium EP7]
MSAEFQVPFRYRVSSAASPSPGVRPRFWRGLRHDPWQRLGVMAVALLPVLGLAMIGAGMLLWQSARGIKAQGFAALLCGCGALVAALGPLVGVVATRTALSTARRFADGQLIPGVVVSTKPLVVMALADLGIGRQGEEFALGRLRPSTLPSEPHEPGTRIACLARVAAEGHGHYLWFTPHPICWGTGESFELKRCLDRLGEAPFRRLEALLRRGPVPQQDQEIVVLDAADKVLDIRHYWQAVASAQDEKRA